MTPTLRISLFLGAALLAASAVPASASTMVFEGQNAGLFPNANPADTAQLMGSVSRPFNPKTAAASATGQITPASLIEQSVESQISAKIYSQIFNSSAASGSFDLGGGSLINFVRTGGNIDITLTDPVHGTTTIVVPDL